MDAFVGRVEELRSLNSIYEKSPVACAVCGRRHLGKTMLVKRFCEGKDHIYLTGMGGLKSENLRQISEAISRYAGRPVRLDDVVDLFTVIRSVCRDRRTVVVIDRYSDLMDNFPEINSYMRSFISREIGSTNIMLLVCDTDSSMFSRFYYTLDVRPMNYLECAGFHPGYTPIQNITVYSLVGGCPAYHRLFGDDLEDTMRGQFFDHMSVLSLEAEGMVNAEAIIRPACVKILSAMAEGHENVRDISQRCEMSPTVCNKLVEDMEHKGILAKEVSSGPSRRSVYHIDSNILRFFYEVVNRYTHQIEFQSPEEAFAAARQDTSDYLERSFVTVCMEYIMISSDYHFIGKLRKRDNSHDNVVDFVASFTENNLRRTAVASCRLNGAPMDLDDLKKLVQRSRTVEGPNKLFYLFSGPGFYEPIRAEARKDRNIRLISLDDLYRR